MKIAHITDIHLDDYLFAEDKINGKENFKTILKDVCTRSIDRIVITGDMGNPDLFDWIVDSVIETRMEYTYVLGNHDDPGNFVMRADARGKVKKTGLFYKEEIDSDLFFYLDASSSKIDDFQKKWVKSVLEESKSSRIMVFLHYPILDCGETTMNRLYSLSERDSVREIFIGSKKDVFIFSGHYHDSFKVVENNITQFVTPSAVMQFKKHSRKLELGALDFGYRIIDIEKGMIRTKVVLFSP